MRFFALFLTASIFVSPAAANDVLWHAQASEGTPKAEIVPKSNDPLQKDLDADQGIEPTKPDAAKSEDTKPQKQQVVLPQDLDELFYLLKRTRDVKLSDRISTMIWEIWQQSESRSIDLLTTWARAAIQRRQFAAALDLLDQVVVIKPDYAEGWNQRATLHFMMKNYGKSIADIERTLALEPRHYGALAGLAAIQQTLGRDKAALATWYRTLEIYPAMKSAQKSVIELEEELAGRSL